jgi:hypothetical protein
VPCGWFNRESDDGVPEKPLGELEDNILNADKRRLDQLVVALEFAGGIVVMCEVDVDGEQAGTTLAEIAIDAVPRANFQIPSRLSRYTHASNFPMNQASQQNEWFGTFSGRLGGDFRQRRRFGSSWRGCRAKRASRPSVDVKGSSQSLRPVEQGVSGGGQEAATGPPHA